MVSGATHTTAETIRPELRADQDAPGRRRSSRACSSCASPTACSSTATARSTRSPTAEQLADIAISSAATAARSSASSRAWPCSPTRPARRARAPTWTACGAATELVRARAPELSVEGPIQYDAAVDAGVARTKLPGSDGGRAGDRVHLPGPQHGQQHLQGRAAQRGRGGDRAGAAGAEQAGQRPLARRARSRTSSTRWRSPPSRRRDEASSSSTAARRRVKYRWSTWTPGRRSPRASPSGSAPTPTLPDHAAALRAALGGPRPARSSVAVAHRVVHGGERFSAPV